MAKDALDLVSRILLVVGGLNWGLVGALEMDLVEMLFGSIPMLQKAVYVIVGLAALYEIYVLAAKKD